MQLSQLIWVSGNVNTSDPHQSHPSGEGVQVWWLQPIVLNYLHIENSSALMTFFSFRIWDFFIHLTYTVYIFLPLWITTIGNSWMNSAFTCSSPTIQWFLQVKWGSGSTHACTHKQYNLPVEPHEPCGPPQQPYFLLHCDDIYEL